MNGVKYLVQTTRETRGEAMPEGMQMGQFDQTLNFLIQRMPKVIALPLIDIAMFVHLTQYMFSMLFQFKINFKIHN